MLMTFERCKELSKQNLLIPDSFGTLSTKRRSIGFGDKGCAYRYNGGRHIAKDWPSWLSSLRSQIQDTCKQSFEFALITEYPTASAALGFHKDNEPEIVPGSTIACISLGSTASMQIISDTNNSILLDGTVT